MRAEQRIPDCVVCDDVGCEFCAAVPEPWPAETFSNLGTRDLEQLIADACRELSRRLTTTGPDADPRSQRVEAS